MTKLLSPANMQFRSVNGTSRVLRGERKASINPDLTASHQDDGKDEGGKLIARCLNCCSGEELVKNQIIMSNAGPLQPRPTTG